jgi:hypothetical protein
MADRAVLSQKYDDKSAEETSKTPGKRGGWARELSSNFAPRKSALKATSALGEYGAATLHWELQRRHVCPLPSLRTIGRILERPGALDGRRRVRRPAPPRGWYLPRVAARRAELDSFDIV